MDTMYHNQLLRRKDFDMDTGPLILSGTLNSIGFKSFGHLVIITMSAMDSFQIMVHVVFQQVTTCHT